MKIEVVPYLPVEHRTRSRSWSPGSRPAGDINCKPGGRLPLLSTSYLGSISKLVLAGWPPVPEHLV